MRRETQGARLLTESAAAAAIAAAIVLLKLVTPLMMAVTMVVSGLPIAAVGVWHGLRWSGAAGAVAAVLVTILAGPRLGLTSGVYAAVMGIALGWGLRKKLSPGRLLWTAGSVYAVYTVYEWTLSIFLLGAEESVLQILGNVTDFLYWICPPLAGADILIGEGGYSLTALVLGGLLFLPCGGWAIGRLNIDLARIVLGRLRQAGWK